MTKATTTNNTEIIVVSKPFSFITEGAALILKLDEATISAIDTMFANDNYLPAISNATSELAVKAYNAVNDLNALVDKNAQNSEITSAISSAKEALSKFSSSVQADWVKELTKLSPVGALDAYLRSESRCASFKLKNPAKDEPHFGVTATHGRLSYKTFNANTKIVTYAVVDKYLQAFASNLNSFKSGDKECGLGVSAPKVVSESAIKAIADAKAESKDIFAGQVSKTKLLKQLNVLVSAMIPEGYSEIVMEKRHLVYLLDGFTNTKDGVMQTVKDKPLMELVLDVMSNRMGYKDIVYKSNLSQNKAK